MFVFPKFSRLLVIKVGESKKYLNVIFQCVSVHEFKEGIFKVETLHDMICVKDRVKEIN